MDGGHTGGERSYVEGLDGNHDRNVRHRIGNLQTGR